MRKSLGLLGRVSLVGGITVGGFGAYQYNTDEGTRRSVTFWQNIFPVYLHYRFYQLLNRDLKLMKDEDADKKYEELHVKYTDQIRDLTYRMRGFYLKQAQLMSTQDDFVPPAYMKWVKDTQDKVPSEFQAQEARDYCRRLLQDELHLSFDDIFTEWDDIPVGVASIGQVHIARLKSNGEKVAVKLLVPGMERKFRADIRTLKAFCQLAMPQHVTAFEEIEKQFCTEFDYREESKNLAEIYSMMIPKWSHVIALPSPHLHLCSKHMLVMEYLDGVKLVDGIKEKYSQLAKLAGKSLQEIENERKEQLKQGNFSLKTMEEMRSESLSLQWMLWYKNYVLNINNVSKVIYEYSLIGPLIAGPLTSGYDITEMPVDLCEVIEILARVHGNQIFEFGKGL